MANFNTRYWELWDEARDVNPKLSRQEFADCIGVTLGQSNGWLDKGNQPDCDTLVKVAKKANVSVSWLVGETEVRNYQMNEFFSGLPSAIIDELVEYADFLKNKKKKRKKFPLNLLKND